MVSSSSQDSATYQNKKVDNLLESMGRGVRALYWLGCDKMGHACTEGNYNRG